MTQPSRLHHVIRFEPLRPIRVGGNGETHVLEENLGWNPHCVALNRDRRDVRVQRFCGRSVAANEGVERAGFRDSRRLGNLVMRSHPSEPLRCLVHDGRIASVQVCECGQRRLQCGVIARFLAELDLSNDVFEHDLVNPRVVTQPQRPRLTQFPLATVGRVMLLQANLRIDHT